MLVTKSFDDGYRMSRPECRSHGDNFGGGVIMLGTFRDVVDMRLHIIRPPISRIGDRQLTSVTSLNCHRY